MLLYLHEVLPPFLAGIVLVSVLWGIRVKKQFLVVDDSELNLRVVELLLNSLGISADCATGADQAFTWLSQKDYDLIMIDYLMPGMDGAEATRIIRRMYGGVRREYFRTVPIVILTAEENPEIVAELMKSGANEVLTKPLTLEALKPVLAKWVPRVHGIGEENLDRMIESDREGFAELISVFCEDIPYKRARIEQALEDDDFKTYTVEVHRIKGECKIIEAFELAETSKMLEFTGKALTGDVPNDKTEVENRLIIASDTPKVLDALERMCPELLSLAEDLLPERALEVSSAAPAAVDEELQNDLAKLIRYAEHAEESLSEKDYSLTAEWLEEIKELAVHILHRSDHAN